MLRLILCLSLATAALATEPERTLEPPRVGSPIHPLPPPVVPAPSAPAVPVVAKPLPGEPAAQAPLTALAPQPPPPTLASTPAELSGNSERAALLRLAETRRRAGDLAGAEAAYRAVIQLSPDAAAAATALEQLPSAAPLSAPPVKQAAPAVPPAAPAAAPVVPSAYPALVAAPRPVMTGTIRVYGYRVYRHRHRHRHRHRRHR